jgi:hypothetical protein
MISMDTNQFLKPYASEYPVKCSIVAFTLAFPICACMSMFSYRKNCMSMLLAGIGRSQEAQMVIQTCVISAREATKK